MRIAGLDGLRAVAVTGVLLYHGGLSELPGGFLGVDLFFVISGYLITTLLLAELTRLGGLDVMGFWGRRVRRLIPGLVLVVAATAVAVALSPTLADARELRGDALAALLYVANWHFLLTGDGYFEQLATPSTLQHTWSLAIEEQFYLLWPLLLLLAWRLRVTRRGLTVVVAAGALLSAAWAAWLAGRGVDADRIYYGTDTRAQALLAGVLVALLLDRDVERSSAGRRLPKLPVDGLSSAAGVTALAGVVTAMVLVRPEDERLYRGGLLAFAVLSAAVVAMVVRTPTGALTRVLEWRPLCAVGVLSYSLYLWHWPVFLVVNGGRTSLSGPALLTVRLVVTLVLAAAAYHLVEARARRAAWWPRRGLALPAGAVAVGCGLALVVSSAVPATPTVINAVGSVVASEAEPVQPSVTRGELLALRRDGLAESPTARPTRPAEPHQLRVTVLGDSTALTLANGLYDVPGRDGVDFSNAAILGCGVSTASPYRYMGELTPYPRTKCRTWQGRWRHRVSSRPTDVVAVLAGRWEVADQVVDGTWTHVGSPLFDEYLRRELLKAVDAASVTGAPVALLTAPYYSRGEQPDGRIWPEDEPGRVDDFNALLRWVAAQRPSQVRVIDFGRRMSGGGQSYVRVVDGVVLRYDGVHFTDDAARWIQPWLTKQLARVARLGG